MTFKQRTQNQREIEDKLGVRRRFVVSVSQQYPAERKVYVKNVPEDDVPSAIIVLESKVPSGVSFRTNVNLHSYFDNSFGIGFRITEKTK